MGEGGVWEPGAAGSAPNGIPFPQPQLVSRVDKGLTSPSETKGRILRHHTHSTQLRDYVTAQGLKYRAPASCLEKA